MRMTPKMKKEALQDDLDAFQDKLETQISEQLVEDGIYSNKEIAKRTHLSTKTVKKMRRNLWHGKL